MSCWLTLPEEIVCTVVRFTLGLMGQGVCGLSSSVSNWRTICTSPLLRVNHRIRRTTLDTVVATTLWVHIPFDLSHAVDQRTISACSIFATWLKRPAPPRSTLVIDRLNARTSDGIVFAYDYWTFVQLLTRLATIQPARVSIDVRGLSAFWQTAFEVQLQPFIRSFDQCFSLIGDKAKPIPRSIHGVAYRESIDRDLDQLEWIAVQTCRLRRLGFVQQAMVYVVHTFWLWRLSNCESETERPDCPPTVVSTWFDGPRGLLHSARKQDRRALLAITYLEILAYDYLQKHLPEFFAHYDQDLVTVQSTRLEWTLGVNESTCDHCGLSDEEQALWHCLVTSEALRSLEVLHDEHDAGQNRKTLCVIKRHATMAAALQPQVRHIQVVVDCCNSLNLDEAPDSLNARMTNHDCLEEVSSTCSEYQGVVSDPVCHSQTCISMLLWKAHSFFANRELQYKLLPTAVLKEWRDTCQ